MQDKSTEETLAELVALVKSSTAIELPAWANPLMDDLAVGMAWSSAIQPFEHPFNQLVIASYVRSKDTLELELRYPDGQRMGLITVHRAGTL